MQLLCLRLLCGHQGVHVVRLCSGQLLCKLRALLLLHVWQVLQLHLELLGLHLELLLLLGRSGLLVEAVLILQLQLKGMLLQCLQVLLLLLC